MCGIAGVLARDPRAPADLGALRHMCDALRHRGPDDAGDWAHGAGAIGMRRLSIIDLAGGHQPIFNEDGTIGVVLNGEIYNYKALRDGLLARGHVLKTHSDTEVIVHLYEEMGERCAEPLRGMFAFAVWDTRTGTLLIGRDRFGIKPLYIAEGRDTIAFASELKALVSAGYVDGALDPDALDVYLQLGYIPAPLSPFVGVRKLEPATTYRVDRGAEPVIRAYWDLPRGERAAGPDVVREVQEQFDDSVKHHLVSDVPVAAFLSGGLDSSAIVASMAIQGETPHAFTARYLGSGAEAADESGLARLLADKYGAKLSVIDIEPAIRDVIEPIVYGLDEPNADESSIPSWFISQAVAREYKVALAGTGGDELFAGYRRHRAVSAGSAYAKLPGWARSSAAWATGLLPEPKDGGLTVNRIKRFARSGGDALPARLVSYVSKLGNLERSALLGAHARTGSVAERIFSHAWTGGGSPEGVRGALYLDYKTYLPDDILAVSDRMASAHSLEVRVPFVDHALVDDIFPLPMSLKIGGGKQKLLLRRALEDRLPAEHFTAPKRGFVGPMAAWLRNELRSSVEDELSVARQSRLGLFEPKLVQGWLEEHMARRENREGVLWALFSFSIWHRLFVEQRGVAPKGWNPRGA